MSYGYKRTVGISFVNTENKIGQSNDDYSR